MQHNVLNLAEMLATITPHSGKKLVATSPKGNALEFPFIKVFAPDMGVTFNLPELVFTNGEWCIRYMLSASQVLKRDKLALYKLSDFEKIEIA